MAGVPLIDIMSVTSGNRRLLEKKKTIDLTLQFFRFSRGHRDAPCTFILRVFD